MPAQHLSATFCWRTCALALSLGTASMLAPAQNASQPLTGIYTCLDDRGRRLTADRPIAACAGKEQQLLNRDGSVRAVIPPTLTAEERTEQEARERATAEARAAQSDAVRRDRNLMARFPTEAAHNKARESALDTVRIAMKATEIRLRELAFERKPLADEAEFYMGKPLPAKLRLALDSNDAAAEAQRAAAGNQQSELARINKIYDAELDRLRRLWAGTPPGTLGPLPAPHVPKPASAPSAPRH
jgi:hypothetical protein